MNVIATRSLTQRIIACVIQVHRTLGPGFLEKIYRRALAIELMEQGLAVEFEKEVCVWYRGVEIGVHRLDLFVEGQVIVELKTVEALGRTHYAQVRSYLRAARAPAALLVNFSGDKADFRRLDP